MRSVKVTRLRPDIVPARLSAVEAIGQLAEHLRECIIGGTLRRGQVLSVRDLARDLGASANHVGGAFQRLIAEGYLVRVRCRTVVAPLYLDARRLLDRRLALEVELTRLATRRMTPFGLRLLDQFRVAMVEAQHRQDLVEIQRSNYRFHTLLYRYADRPDLLEEVRTVWAGFPFDLMTTMPSRMPAVADEHSAVLAMVGTGDVRSAGRAMHRHILRGWQEFQRHYPLQLEQEARRVHR